MDNKEDELAKHIATKCLGFKIYFNDKSRVVMELGGNKWVFAHETDAEAVEEITKIFTSVSAYMWKVVNERVLNWVSNNKRSFN
jgi:hypothetical protein